MVGAVPNMRADNRADRTPSDGRVRVLRAGLISALVPLSLTLVQCGKAPNPAALAANSQANVQVVAKTHPQVARADTFEDRFPAPQFKERFPSASESLEKTRTASPARPSSNKVSTRSPTTRPSLRSPRGAPCQLSRARSGWPA